MKQFFSIMIMLLLAAPAFAADIDVVEARKDSTGWNIEAYYCSLSSQYCTVIWKKGYEDSGTFVYTGEERRVRFENVADDPSTEEVDESKTEFTQLIQLINNNSNIKQSFITATKVKLGL